MPAIQVQNMAEVLSALNRVRHGYNERDVAKVLFEVGAKPLRDEVRDAAPQGPTGNLKRAVQAYIARARELAPATYVRVNRHIARHLHLVSFGTKPHVEKPKVKQAIFFPGAHPKRTGVSFSPFAVTHHPGAKANDYFRQTWERLADSIADRISEALGRLLDKAAR